jgi:hypothetical protein
VSRTRISRFLVLAGLGLVSLVLTPVPGFGQDQEIPRPQNSYAYPRQFRAWYKQQALEANRKGKLNQKDEESYSFRSPGSSGKKDPGETHSPRGKPGSASFNQAAYGSPDAPKGGRGGFTVSSDGRSASKSCNRPGGG